MIRTLSLLRNLAQFENVASGAQLPLAATTLFHSENGRGKTTIAESLRSFGDGDPAPISERARLGATNPPHIVVETDDGLPAAVFTNGAWSRTDSNVLVFDDVFVDRNVHSGLTVASGHRQRLHELVLGAQAVAIVERLQAAIERIEVHNANLRGRSAAIPATLRGRYSVDDFCALPEVENVEAVIEETRRNLAVAGEREIVARLPALDPIQVPALDVGPIDELLQRSLADIDEQTLERVHEHVAHLGRDGESWVSDGVRHIDDGDLAECPFCGQNLTGSSLVELYRIYFGAEYAQLKRDVVETLITVQRLHGGDAQAFVERALRQVQDGAASWAKYVELPPLALPTDELAHAWRTAREAVLAALEIKQLRPLEPAALSQDARQAIEAFRAQREVVLRANDHLEAANLAIAVARERAIAANATTLSADFARLIAIASRHSEPVSTYCREYLEERTAKETTEQERDQLRVQLDALRTTVFPGYQEATNRYLQRFNAEFRLANVASVNTRGGPTVTYNVLVNGNPIIVGGGEPQPGVPSFKSALSAGDRNTLALAFFFALLDQDPNCAARIVVVDDPITSLDDQRSWATIQELRRLADRVAQVVVLSHEKPFLCRLWDRTDRLSRTAIELYRDARGSNMRVWDVADDSLTDHDRRDAQFREYLEQGTTDLRAVAAALRPHLEAYLRVGAPSVYRPGMLLGAFLTTCRNRLGNADQVLDAVQIGELEQLVDYANRFHHDTNPAFATAPVTDGEVSGMVRRVMEFTRP